MIRTIMTTSRRPARRRRQRTSTLAAARRPLARQLHDRPDRPRRAARRAALRPLRRVEHAVVVEPPLNVAEEVVHDVAVEVEVALVLVRRRISIDLSRP